MAPCPPPGQVGGGGQVPPVQAAGPPPTAMDAGDWRTQLKYFSRRRIVHKILDTLKKHLPFSGPEGLQELTKIAVRFEEKMYAAATSQTDYLRKISMKMLAMETRSQRMANSIQSNSASGRAPSDQGVANQSQPRQPLILQNMMRPWRPQAKRKIQSKSPWAPITRSRAKKLRGC